ncbi:MAG: hypothetical protein QOF52_1218 [Propionibacteriaceae bacterium]|jgi:hypothetical protein|nr:Lsr2-like protein [Propionibacteriaceae bacterium]MDX6321360.1 hypothetical protein [Propionibacteriaceae bacterium]
MQRVVTELVDDLDGTDADETVTFSIDGVSYEIDLASHNAESLRKGLEDYVTNGRRIGGRAKRSVISAAHRDVSDTRTVREWAEQNGYAVSARGRIPSAILEAYEAAH